MKVAIGVSPDHAAAYDDAVEQSIVQATSHKDVVAIGSCGMHDANDRCQMDVFERQIALAKTQELVLIVEASGAYDAAFELVAKSGIALDRVLLRAFDGSLEQLAPWVNGGCFVSFDGRMANDPAMLCSLVDALPADRVLVESGAPTAQLDLLAGEPSRTDQVVFLVDIINSRVSAEQIARNAASLYL